MVHKTKGIILRRIPYGETSLICTIFTELFGVQSYMIKGARTGKSGSNKANILFPCSVLDMVVYYHPHKNLQTVKELNFAYLYKNLQDDVVRNGVALFAIEVALKLIVTDSPQPELFAFLEDFLQQADTLPTNYLANMPIHFLIKAGNLSGYRIAGRYSDLTPHVIVSEGQFTQTASMHTPTPTLSNDDALLLSQLLEADKTNTIQDVKMSVTQRRTTLHYLLAFLEWHVPGFSALKTLPVLTAILY